MNLAVIGLAGAALVTSVVAINGGQPEKPGRAMVYQSELQSDARPQIAVKPMRAEKAKLGEVLNKLGAEAAGRTVVRWNALNECGMDGGEEVNFDAPLGDLASTVAAINEARGLNANDVGALDYRVKDGVIEFAPRGVFDRRETVLVCYDIGDLIDADIDLEEMCGVITSFVDPEAWRDNGGDLGSMQIVGRRMFVKAPPRMQDGVRWIMEQLTDKERPEAMIDADLPGVVKAYPLKHAAAPEVLRAIMANQQIRAIDFTSFVVDERSNSIIGRASKPEHRIVQDAIEALDVERAPAAAGVSVQANNLVYISGLVARPGPYNHPGDELTLRRMLIAASIQPEATEARVVRGPAEQPMTIGTLRGAELFDPTGADFEIKPGDIVTVK